MTVAEVHRESCSLRHEAFIYDSDEAYTTTLVPLLHAAVAAGDTVIAVVPRRSTALLRSAVGSLRGIDFIDAEAWYEHPITTIASYDRVLRELPTSARAFVIGEVQFGLTQADWVGWTRYEAALNIALDRYDARVVCPYDARVLPPAVVVDARRTHPYVLLDRDRRPSVDYVDAETLFASLAPTVTIPASPPAVDLVIGRNLRAARGSVESLAGTHRLSRARLDELTLAVNELVTNAVVHGGGSARLRLWSTADGIVCAVDDSGSGIEDPLVGFTAPPTGSVGGYGTWLARRIFERTEFFRSPTGGLCVVASTTT